MRAGLMFSIGLLASVAAGIESAAAADLSVKARPAPPPAPVSNWTGFYIGIHGGWGWGHTSYQPAFVSNSPLVLAVTPPDANPKGGFVGGQAGYNWQWEQAVGGLEVDFSGADLDESSAFTIANPLFTGFNFTRDEKIDELASARLRLGYLVLPDLLIYGTGGAGWGHSRLNTTQLATGVLVSSTSDSNEFGWVAGGGLEWRLWDHWLLRGEYLHYDFGSHNDNANPNFFFPGTTTPPFAEFLNTRTTVDVARAALSYKF